MMEVDNYQTVVSELIPSINKEESWKAYLGSLDSLLKGEIGKDRCTSIELKQLHLLVTSPLTIGELPNHIKEDMLLDLYTLDREDDEFIQRLLNDKLKPLIKEATEKQMPLPEYYRKAREIYKEICAENTEINFNPQLRGELRRYGTRRIKIGDGRWEKVYASHTCDRSTEMEQFAAIASGGFPFPPTAYYGLSVGLGEVYERMCAEYDLINKRDTSFFTKVDINRKLLAESFLQLIGTRVLHPFWDANGRTFGTHLALTLEREGIQLRDYRVIEDIISKLTPHNNKFLDKILEDANLAITGGQLHYSMKLNHGLRQDYMKKLRKTIEDAISHGINKNGPYFKYYSDAAWLIKRTLADNGLVELTQEEVLKIKEEKDKITEERERMDRFWKESDEDAKKFNFVYPIATFGRYTGYAAGGLAGFLSYAFLSIKAMDYTRPDDISAYLLLSSIGALLIYFAGWLGSRAGVKAGEGLGVSLYNLKKNITKRGHEWVGN